MIPFLLPISHGLTDTFNPIFFFYQWFVFTSVVDLDSSFLASYRMRNHIWFRNIISLSLSKVLSIGINLRRYRAQLLTCDCCFWIFDAGSTLKHSVMLFSDNYPSGRRSSWNPSRDWDRWCIWWSVIEIQSTQSDSPLRRAAVGIWLDTRTNEKENKEEVDLE